MTGARRDRVPNEFEPILTAAENLVRSHGDDGALYLYGSVATGQARAPLSDVDLITVDLDRRVAHTISQALSRRFADMCREVDIGGARTSDYIGDTDVAYGNRVFLRHYCVHLSGPRHHQPRHDYPADARAARGFNGDVAIHAHRWRLALEEGTDSRELGRRLAWKVLLAVAGLVSIHDGTWTTDRAGAASRWAEVQPALRPNWTRSCAGATACSSQLAWTSLASSMASPTSSCGASRPASGSGPDRQLASHRRRRRRPPGFAGFSRSPSRRGRTSSLPFVQSGGRIPEEDGLMTTDITNVPIHLGVGGTARPVKDFDWSAERLAAYDRATRADGADGRLVMMFHMVGAWTSWERHPLGAEVVIACTGTHRFVQELMTASESSRSPRDRR